MNSQPTELGNVPQVRKPLGWRIVKWTVLVVVALVVLAAVAWGILDYVSGKILEAEIAKLRAAGQPVTFTQMEESLLKVKESEDAAPFYKAALALRRSSTDGKVSDLFFGLRPHMIATSQPTTAPAPSAKEIEVVLADNALALEMVDRGAKLPQCAYDWGLRDRFFFPLSSLQGSRYLAELLALRTLWLAQQGHSSEAVNSLISSLRMLRMYDRQPLLIQNLVKTSGISLCVNSLSAILKADSLSDKQLAAIASALEDVDPNKEMHQAWLAEWLYTLESHRFLVPSSVKIWRDDELAFPQAYLYLYGRSGKPWLRLMCVSQLRLCGNYMQAMDQGWPGALDAVRATRPRGVLGLFAPFLAPSLEQAVVFQGRTLGTVRSAQVAVMVERYRLAKGRLPASLKELRDFVGHDLPADPFTGKDLIYKVQGKGFMVYSVGENKVDDGGPVQALGKDWGLAVRWGPGK